MAAGGGARHRVTASRGPILGLDIGTRRCGWALGKPGALSFGTIVLASDPIDACAGFRHILDTRLAGVELVIAERPIIGGRISPDVMMTCGWMWRELGIACRREGIEIMEVYPGTLKKRATGHGAAKDAAMKTAARALGHAVTDDHQADAVLLLEHFSEPKKKAGAIAFSHTL